MSQTNIGAAPVNYTYSPGTPPTIFGPDVCMEVDSQFFYSGEWLIVQESAGTHVPKAKFKHSCSCAVLIPLSRSKSYLGCRVWFPLSSGLNTVQKASFWACSPTAKKFRVLLWQSAA